MNYSNSNGSLLKNIIHTRQKQQWKLSYAENMWAAHLDPQRHWQCPIGTRVVSISLHEKLQKLVYTSQVKNYYMNNLGTSSDISEACQQFNHNEAPGQDIHEKFRRSYFEKDGLAANRFLVLRKNT